MGTDAMDSWAAEVDRTHKSAPRGWSAPAGKKVISVAAGKVHTAVWTDGGDLFTFGYGSFGVLGHGGEESEYICTEAR